MVTIEGRRDRVQRWLHDYPCEKCGKLFSSRKAMREHKRQEHSY